jgi:hypothetical protein
VSGGGNTADFGRKVLTAVLRAIENRPEMVVIMAGYNEEMNRLISANVGLSSRITKHVNFEDMNRDALGHVLDLMAGQRQYTMAPEAREHILDQIEAARKTLGVREFGNARLVRNVVDKFRVTLGRRHFGAAAKATTVDEGNQARSASPAVKDLRHVTLEDARSLNYGMVLGLAGKKPPPPTSRRTIPTSSPRSASAVPCAASAWRPPCINRQSFSPEDEGRRDPRWRACRFPSWT